ncbi:MAG: methyltransferase domain-containing protein [Streptosporangiales bacterium]|nr:methyltransferase domain-containing protein [Streptosporangiales bacterium]
MAVIGDRGNTDRNYVFDDAWYAERARIGSLEAALDAGTIRHLEDLGVAEGWRCLDVGAGAGSIAVWLCGRVGAGGRVVACDVQTKFLDVLDHPELDVLRHDIAVAGLPEGFDLVHVRWTLHWPPQRAAAVKHVVDALRPGGWLLAEEPDFVTTYEACTSEVLRRVWVAATAHVETISGGMDTRYGRRLPGDLATHGLTDLEMEGRVHLFRGGDDRSGARWMRLTIEKVGREIVESGAVTAAEFEEAVLLLEDPTFATMSPVTVAVWGRKPAA